MTDEEAASLKERQAEYLHAISKWLVMYGDNIADTKNDSKADELFEYITDMEEELFMVMHGTWSLVPNGDATVEFIVNGDPDVKKDMGIYDHYFSLLDCSRPSSADAFRLVKLSRYAIYLFEHQTFITPQDFMRL